ncbi:Rna exonuclease 3 [Quillaja saponaria]|uniref:Rna exonuclease 3 n=1 Tax=Quillaja saponaria TaxID=32244 RepID=A0AAD7Q8R6_QUISA|nr:Rna exonuclease 3 [Quillaja saponaria]
MKLKRRKDQEELRLKSSRITRSHSTSSSTQKSPKNLRRSASLHILPKSMSCRTLGELELEEVKGFMDLGFIFKKEHLSPRMMSVLPGLQRLGVHKNEQNTKLMDAKKTVQDDNDDGDEIEEGSRSVIRPYLSEAWLIRKPDSPLLNLRMPKVSTAADMKKYIRSWARTVASVIQQES